MTNSRLTDPEVLEFRFPVRLDSYAIRTGSGGAGRWRGGDGGVRRVRFLEPMTASILSNGRTVPAFGMAGGAARALGINRVERADGRVETLGHIGSGRDGAGRRVRDRDAGRRRLGTRDGVGLGCGHAGAKRRGVDGERVPQFHHGIRRRARGAVPLQRPGLQRPRWHADGQRADDGNRHCHDATPEPSDRKSGHPRVP
jgi:hypothetical protein